MEHIIWDCNAGYNDDFQKAIMQDYADEYPDMTEADACRLAVELNDEYLADERISLNINLDNNIVAIATLGLWNGPKSAYKVMGKNIAGCLSSNYDPVWYVDKNGDFRCREAHHDGTNEILYREFKDISETQKENFLQKVYDGVVTRQDITRYTRRVGDRIAAVYGWTIRKSGNKVD